MQSTLNSMSPSKFKLHKLVWMWKFRDSLSYLIHSLYCIGLLISTSYCKRYKESNQNMNVDRCSSTITSMWKFKASIDWPILFRTLLPSWRKIKKGCKPTRSLSFPGIRVPNLKVYFPSKSCIITFYYMQISKFLKKKKKNANKQKLHN